MRARTRRIIGAATTLVAVASVATLQVADATLAGGGETVLTATLSPGIPAGAAPCVAQTVVLTGAAQVIAIQQNGFDIPAYAGPVDVNGNAVTGCADIDHEFGSVTNLSVTGQSGLTQNTVSCPNLFGGYDRVGPAVLASLAGSCTVNGQLEPIVGLIAVGAFRPTKGDGVQTAITQATFTGGFTLTS